MRNFTLSHVNRVLIALLVVLSLGTQKIGAQQYKSTSPPPVFPPSNVSHTQDRDQMMYQLGITFPTNLPVRNLDPNRPPDAYPLDPNNLDGNWSDSLGTGNTIQRTDWGLWNNYHDNKVGVYTPIDLLKMKDGTVVTTADQWWNQRRPEIEKDVKQQLWGVIPPDSILPKVTWSVVTTTGVSGGSAYIQKAITGTIDISRYPSVRNRPKITATLMIPANAKGRVPVMVVFASASSYYNDCAAHGWGVCGYTNTDLQPDDGVGLTSYLIGLCNKGNWRTPSQWGALGAWSWGISRLMDYFSTDANVDSTKVGVSGHSRYGKATIVNMAYDKRIFICYPSCAGSLGYKIIRRQWGQNLENSCWDQEYHWMAGNLLKWGGPLYDGQYMPRKVENLPVDGFSLLSLCAPRPVFGNDGLDGTEPGDTWQDYEGAYLSMITASPVWKLLGKKGLITNDPKPIMDSAYIQGDLAFRWHHEGHFDSPDWPSFWRFSVKYYKPAYLVTSAASFGVADTARKASFTITSDTTWTITGPSWITIYPSSGKYNGTISLQFPRNLTNGDLTDTIKVNAPGIYQKIVFTQKAQALSISPTTLSLTDTTTKSKFTITSDTTWSITTPSWVIASPTSGKSNSSISLQFQRNLTNAIRIDTVRIMPTGLKTVKLVITQAMQTLSVAPSAMILADTANSKGTFAITSDTTWSVGFASGSPWLTANPASGKFNKTITLTAGLNNTGVIRIDTVKISAPGVTIKKIVVNQVFSGQTIASTIDSTNISLPAASKDTVRVTSNTIWTISSSQPWVTLSTSGGTNNAKVGLAIAASTGAAPRTTNITVTAPDATPKVFTITQAGGQAPTAVWFSLSTFSGATSLNIPSAPYSSTNIWPGSSTSLFTVSSSAPWLTITGGTGPSNFGGTNYLISPTIAATVNNTFSSRTANLVMSFPGSSVTFTLPVTQAGKTLNFSLSKTTMVLASTVGSNDKSYITCDTTWTATKSQSWLSLNKTSGNKNDSIIATVSSAGTAIRIDTIKVTAASTTITKYIIVASGVPTLTVSNDMLNFTSDAGATSIVINSNAVWTVTCPQSFVNLSTASGAGNGMVVVSVGQNPFTPARTATITVSCLGLSKVITVNQGINPTLYVTVLKQNFNATMDSSVLWINTNGNFTISSDGSWLTASPTTNAGIGVAGSIGMVFAKVDASANPNTTERTATVVVSVSGTTSQSFIFTQAGKTNTGVEDVITEADGVVAYPNPVNSILYVKIDKLPCSISLLDVEGQELLMVNANASITEIDMAGFKSGMYILRMGTDGKMITKKIVKD